MKARTCLPAIVAVLLTVHAASSPALAKVDIGMNLSFLTDYATDFPFIDIMKVARGYYPVKSDGSSGGANGREGDWVLDTSYLRGLTLDEQGYPVELPVTYKGESVAVRVLWHYHLDNRYPAGHYTFLYDGEGEIVFKGDAQVVSSEPGKIVVNLVPGSNYWREEGLTAIEFLSSTRGNHLRNMRFLMPGYDETNYDPRFPWNPVFLEYLRPFKVIRFMNWQNTNFSRQVNWEDRRPPDWWRQGYIQGIRPFAAHGASIEYMINLCNNLKAAPWFCMPHAATDDYNRRFALLVKEQLDPSLPVYLEYSNEAWNSRFDCLKWLNTVHPENGWSYYGQHAANTFAIWHEAFGSEKGRVKRVLAGQKKRSSILAKAIEKCGQAGEDFDFGSCATYWPTDGNTNYQADGSGVPIGFLNEIESESSETNTLVAENIAVVKQEGKPFVSYEGGLAGDGATASEPLVLGHGLPEMKNVMVAYLENLERLGVTLHTHFLLTQAWESGIGKFDFKPWSLMNGLWGDINKAYKYQGVLQYLGVELSTPVYPYPNAVPLDIGEVPSTVAQHKSPPASRPARPDASAQRLYSISGRLVGTTGGSRAGSPRVLIRSCGEKQLGLVPVVTP